MKPDQQVNAVIDGHDFTIDPFSPTVLPIGLDGRLVFSEGQFKSDVTVDVAVRTMMNHLPNGPTTWSVWGIKLFVGQRIYFFFQSVGERGDV